MAHALDVPGMANTSPHKTEPKTRRPHKKSRFGCTKCKERRIKCDELTPRCTRCRKMNLTCQYRKKKDWWAAEGDAGTDSAEGGSPQSSCASSREGRWFDSALRAQAAQMLGPAEFDLLEHYLEHTSRDPTVDDEDKYTLRIGIPSLACQSRPLMCSVLALAAVCKCCDIINNQPLASRDDRGQVVELLSLAHGYHLESLREIQATLHETDSYDYVLANAAMMGMYGSGSHCTRIWLAKTATLDDPRLSDYLTPEHSQWISLFRAVRLAYAGLLNNSPSQASTPIDPMLLAPSPMQHREPPPRPIRTNNAHAAINHPLGPILAATVGSAMARLHEKAGEIAVLQAVHETMSGGQHNSPKLQSCYTALSILSDIVAVTFPPSRADDAPHTRPSTPAVPVDPLLAGGHAQLLEVSPWLRKYTASISSMTPSRLPRRTVMAFVHKVPGTYLALVEEILGLIHSGHNNNSNNNNNANSTSNLDPVMMDTCMDGASPSTSPLSVSFAAAAGPGSGGGGGGEGAGGEGPEPSLAHQLALDIFAHWLVLVLLLDNVWWIGGTGAFELDRVVVVRQDARWRGCLWNRDRDWWPQSMCEVSRQFEKHR